MLGLLKTVPGRGERMHYAPNELGLAGVENEGRVPVTTFGCQSASDVVQRVCIQLRDPRP